MWGQIATALAALAGVAIATFAGTTLQWRERRALREEAELLKELDDDFPGRRELVEHIELGIRRYVARASNPWLARSERNVNGARTATFGLLTLVALLLAASMGVGVSNEGVVPEQLKDTMTVLTWITVAVEVAWMVMAWRHRRRVRAAFVVTEHRQGSRPPQR